MKMKVETLCLLGAFAFYVGWVAWFMTSRASGGRGKVGCMPVYVTYALSVCLSHLGFLRSWI